MASSREIQIFFPALDNDTVQKNLQSSFENLSPAEKTALLTDEKLLRDFNAETKTQIDTLRKLLKGDLGGLTNSDEAENKSKRKCKNKKRNSKKILNVLLDDYIRYALEEQNQAICTHLPSPSDKTTDTSTLHTPLLSNSADNKSEVSTESWRKICFVFIATLIGFFGIMDGMAGIVDLAQYICQSMHWTFIVPLAIGVSLFFGVVQASITAVFDIKAVANEMGVSYLTAHAELKHLLKCIKELKIINKNLEKAIRLSANDVTAQKQLKEILNNVAINQTYVCKRLDAFETAFKKTKQKRLTYKIAWTLLAAPLYAGGVNMSAVYIIGLLPTIGFPIIPPIAGLTFAGIWITVELFRFYQLENKSMCMGVDALWGSPIANFMKAKKTKASVTVLHAANVQHNEQYTGLLTKIDTLSKKNKKLEKTNFQLTTENSRLNSANRNSLFSSRETATPRPSPRKPANTTGSHP